MNFSSRQRSPPSYEHLSVQKPGLSNVMQTAGSIIIICLCLTRDPSVSLALRRQEEGGLTVPPWVQFPLYPPNAHSILGYIQKKSELEWAQRQWAREHEVTDKLEDIRQDTVTKVDNGVYQLVGTKTTGFGYVQTLGLIEPDFYRICHVNEVLVQLEISSLVRAFFCLETRTE